jgi:sulfur-oxidizing protein SoxB
MSGAQIKEVLEAVADNLFHPDPYLQQGGDMVRVGGLGFTAHVDATLGQRIANLHLLRTGAPIEAGKDYVVAGWASVNEGTEGPPIWDVMASHLQGHAVVTPPAAANVSFVRAAN